MSIDSSNDAFPELSADQIVETFKAPSLPPPHEAEMDTFARHKGVPGHDQQKVAEARITLVGSGGLNSWVALGLARAGARNLTSIDPDFAERTNLTRQFYFAEDLGQPKAIRLSQNLVRHTIAGGSLTGIALPFEEAAEEFALPTDLLIVGVDNNACRLSAVKFARARRIPAVFTMLSMDGMRCQSFLQGASENDACLWCALPNLDPESTAPCAAAVISTCFLAASFTLFFAHRALMGWPESMHPFNWRESDLQANAPDHHGHVPKRDGCSVCRS